MAFDAGSIEASITLDRTPFSRGLGAARAEAAKFAQSRPAIELFADIAGVTGPVTTALAAVRGFAGQDATAKLEAEDNASSTIAKATAKAEAFDGTDATADLNAGDKASPKVVAAMSLLDRFAAQTATATAGLNDQATPKLTAIQALLTRYAGDQATATADLNDQATVKLTGIQALMLKIAGANVTATAGVNDNATTKLTAIQALLTHLNGQEVNVKVDVNDNATSPLRTIVKAFGDGRTGAALFRGALVGLGGALAGLTTPAVGLGAALAGAVTGFGLVAAAAIGTFNDIQLKEGQFVAKQGAVLSQSQQRLVANLNAFAGAYKAAMAPAESAVANLASDTLNFLKPALTSIGQAASASAQAVSAAFGQMKAAFTVPAQLTIFQNYLANIPALVEPAIVAAGKLALALFNIFAVPVNSGMAAKLLQDFQGIADAALRWTQSAEGQAFLLDLFTRVEPVIRNVAWAIGQVALGLATVATSQPAIDLMNNLAILLGTIGQNIPAFIPFLAMLNQALSLFNALPQPVQNAVIQLAALNFVLGGIPLAILGGFIGLMWGMIKTTLILRALGLPSMFSLITGSLGPLGAAISSFVSTALFYLEYFFVISLPEFATAALEFFTATIPGAIGAGLGPIAVALAALVGSWYYILGPAGIIVGVLLGFVAFIAGGWVALVVAAVVSAAIAIGVAIYRNWDSIKVAAQSLVTWWGSLPGWLQSVFAGALAAANPLGGLLAYVLSISNALTTGGYGQSIIGWFQNLPGWAQTALGVALGTVSIFDPLFNVINAVIAWFQQGGPQGVLDWFASLPGWAYNALASALSSVGIFDPLFGVIQSAIDWFSGGAESGFVAWFTNLPGYLYNGLIEGISGLSSGLFGPIVDGVQSILDWLGRLPDSFKAMASNLIIGFINGVASYASQLWHAVVDPIKSAYEAAKSYLNIASPSKLFAGLGKNVALGFAQGITGLTPHIERAAQGMAEAAASAASGVRLPSVAAPSMNGIARNFPAGEVKSSSRGIASSQSAAAVEGRRRRGHKRKKDYAVINVHIDGKLMKRYVDEVNYESLRRSITGGSHLVEGF